MGHRYDDREKQCCFLRRIRASDFSEGHILHHRRQLRGMFLGVFCKRLRRLGGGSSGLCSDGDWRRR